MATTSPTDLRAAQQAGGRARLASLLQRQGALIALVLLVIFGALRYDGFLGAYNITEVLRYNSMFGLIALGMTFVIMSGGIDLSVGGVAALASVLAALLSPYGALPAVLVPVLAGNRRRRSNKPGDCESDDGELLHDLLSFFSRSTSAAFYWRLPLPFARQ